MYVKMCLGGKHKASKIPHFPAPLDAQLIWCLQLLQRTTNSEEAKTRTEFLTRFHTRCFGFGGTGDHLGPTGEDLTAKG